MQAYGAEDHSYVHSGIHPLVSLDLHHHVLVHLFQIPERFGYQVLVLAIKESCGLLNQIGVLVVSSKISLKQQDFMSTFPLYNWKDLCLHKDNVFIGFDIVAGRCSLQLSGGLRFFQK